MGTLQRFADVFSPRGSVTRAEAGPHVYTTPQTVFAPTSSSHLLLERCPRETPPSQNGFLLPGRMSNHPRPQLGVDRSVPHPQL